MDPKAAEREAVLYDPSVTLQANLQSKQPFYSRFTWTQNLHTLSKPLVPSNVEGIMSTFSEDRKKYERMRQMRFALTEGVETQQVQKAKSPPQVPPLRKTLKPPDALSDSDEEVARKKQPKPTIITRVSSNLDKFDQLLTSRSGETELLKEQIAELTKHAKKRQMFQIETWREKYEELFGDRELFTERTAEMDRAFTRRIDEIQAQLSPGYRVSQQQEDVTRRRQMSSQVTPTQKKAPEVLNPVKERYIKLREKERAMNKAVLKERAPTLPKHSNVRRVKADWLRASKSQFPASTKA